MTKTEKGQKQRDRVFAFIQRYIQSHTFAPSYKEIHDELGLVPSHINYVLGQLHAGGKIIWSPGVSRGIALPAKRIQQTGYMAPIAGTIAAGTGVLVPETDFSIYDWEARIGVPDHLIPRGVEKNTICALRVDGYSMKDDGVLDGDLVIGQVTDQWNPRDMVAAWIVDERSATLKRIEETDRRNIRLVPASSAFLPRIFEREKILVQARIFAIFHRYWE